MKNKLFAALVLTLLCTVNSRLTTAHAQGTAFSYQGQLQNNGSPASGTYALTFALFNTNASGVAIAGPVTNNPVGVSNGLFTVLIDFGPGVFTGQTNWLQIGVATNGVNTFSPLTPRQQLTPVPYAIFAQTASNVSGTFTGNGGGLTNLNAAQLTSIGNTNDGASGNVFVGPSGNSTTSGQFNTAEGSGSLTHNTSGSQNTAVGSDALDSNSSGSHNTAIGDVALLSNMSGSDNTAVGYYAFYSNRTGNNNTAVGYYALGYVGTANGAGGTNNIALGYQAGLNYLNNESYNIDIGNQGLIGDYYTTRIGTPGVQTNTVIAGVINGNGGGLTNVYAESLGGSQLSTVNSQGILVGTNIYLNNYPMYLRGDQNHGLAYNGGTVTNFGTGNVQVDGPVLWGYTGGALAVMSGGAHAVLTWTNGGVSVTGGFAYSSDRNMKTGFAALDPQAVLARVAALPMSSWFYKTDTGARHLGPMAQDFHAAFALGGGDDKHINVGDEGGVALAAIQGLNQKLDEKDAELEALQQSVADLKQLVQTLAAKK